MKLIHTIEVLTEEKKYPEWIRSAFYTNDYRDLEREGYLKLFSGDISLYYKALKKYGAGEKFLKRIYNVWPHSLYWFMQIFSDGIPAVLLNNSHPDKDLIDFYIVDNFINTFPELEKDENGRILLTLNHGSKANFFSENTYSNSHQTCYDLALEIFMNKNTLTKYLTPEDFSWTDKYFEEIVDILTEENYIFLLQDILQNHPTLSCFREEFEPWVEKDLLGRHEFYLTPDRMNSFLKNDRYNFAVLLECAPELKPYVHELKTNYLKALGIQLYEDYYKTYNDEVEKILGEPIDSGSYTKMVWKSGWDEGKWQEKKVVGEVYDITNLVHKSLLDMLRSSSWNVTNTYSFTDLYREIYDELCPETFEEPINEEEFEDRYNQMLEDDFKYY